MRRLPRQRGRPHPHRARGYDAIPDATIQQRIEYADHVVGNYTPESRTFDDDLRRQIVIAVAARATWMSAPTTTVAQELDVREEIDAAGFTEELRRREQQALDLIPAHGRVVGTASPHADTYDRGDDTAELAEDE